MSVLNAVRNKILHRVCAVIKRGTPYESHTTPTLELQQDIPVEQCPALATFAHRAKRKRALLESNSPGINPTNDGLRPRVESGHRSLPKARSSACLRKTPHPLGHVIE
jgi:hypothetical protein